MNSVTRTQTSILVSVLGGFFALLLLCSPGAWAQGAAAADPERVAAAKELMVVTGGDKQLDNMISVMGQSFRKGVGDTAGSAAAEAAGTQFDRFMKQMLTYRQAMLEEFAVIYAQRFTSDELKAVTAFYRSAAGQKFIQAMPELMQVGSQIGIKYAQKTMKDLKGSAR